MRIFHYLYVLILRKTIKQRNMDKTQIYKLQRLGIDTNQTTIDIFDNLLNLCEFLYDELEIREEDRFKLELYRLKKPTN